MFPIGKIYHVYGTCNELPWYYTEFIKIERIRNMGHVVVFQLTLILLFGLVGAWIFKKFNFSTLIGFLLVGTIIGPGCLDLTGMRDYRQFKEQIAAENKDAKNKAPIVVDQNRHEESSISELKENDENIPPPVAFNDTEESNITEEGNKFIQPITKKAVLDQDIIEIENSAQTLDLFTEFGVILLLFAIALEFSLDKFLAMARYMFVGGVLQMTLCIVPAIFIFRCFGLTWQVGTVVGCVIALSSTALVYKSMAECDQADTKNGRATLGILLFQDIALVPMLLLIPMLFSSGGEDLSAYWFGSPWIDLPLKSLIFCGAVVFGRPFIMYFLVPRLARFKSNELVILFAIVVLLLMCSLAETLHLTPALGALAAGVMLGENRLTHQIDALVLPMRESFSALFFISLGMLMDFTYVFHHPLLCFAALAGVILFKGVASSLAMMACGMNRKEAIGFGLSISQVGELDFMLLAIAYSAKALPENVYNTILFVSVASLVITANMVKFALARIPVVEEKSKKEAIDPMINLFLKSGREHVIIIGIGQIGTRLAGQLELLGKSIALVDYNPLNLQSFAQEGIPTFAGDGADHGLLVNAGIRKAKMVIVVVPDDHQGLNIVHACRSLNTSCMILARSRYYLNIGAFRRAGAQTVICEEVDVSDKLISMLADVS